MLPKTMEEIAHFCNVVGATDTLIDKLLYFISFFFFCTLIFLMFCGQLFHSDIKSGDHESKTPRR